MPTILGRLLFVLALALAPTLAAQETRVVSGVVVDAQSRAPVADVLVTIQGTDLRSVTDADGRFRVSGVPVGSVRLVLRHVGYGEHAQPVVVDASGPLDFQIRISSQAIELSPMVVEVASTEEQARRASGFATNVIDRATIEAFALRGQGLLPFLTGRVPSLRVIGSCVEYRLQVYLPPQLDPDTGETTGIACRDITVYLDGIPIPQGSSVLESLNTEDVERIQVLSPGDAGARYAGSGRGVILVETRRGVAPETPDRRVTITGFGWDEPQPYRWLRVLGVSVVGNAAMAGLTSRAFSDCSGDMPVTPLRCSPMVGTGAALATSTVSSMLTRWAGRTPLSEGRTVPALLIGTATASIGYMLYVNGVMEDSDTSRTAGQIVLAVGMPLSLTLSDRVMRVMR
jgi:hypothetical protein